MAKIAIPDSLPKYRCPKCGSYNILCECTCISLLSKENGIYYNEWLEPDYVDETKRCECLDCNHTGYLYQWEEKE